MRHLAGRWLSTLFIATVAAVTAAACGSSPSGVTSPGVPDAGIPDATGFSMFTTGDSGGTSCTPKTCAELGYNCGMNGDGCGAALDCGACPSGQICGAAGYSRCGAGTTTVSDGGDDGGQASSCTPTTRQSLGIDCG